MVQVDTNIDTNTILNFQSPPTAGTSDTIRIYQLDTRKQVDIFDLPQTSRSMGGICMLTLLAITTFPR